MKRFALLAAILAAFVLLVSSVYTLSETEQAVLTQFGRPVGGVVKDPGLHLKVPLIQEVHRFDKRWLEYDGDPNEIPTKDKKYIWVDTYARWRIADPLRFYTAVRTVELAEPQLAQLVSSSLRRELGQVALAAVSPRYTFMIDDSCEPTYRFSMSRFTSNPWVCK